MNFAMHVITSRLLKSLSSSSPERKEFRRSRLFKVTGRFIGMVNKRTPEVGATVGRGCGRRPEGATSVQIIGRPKGLFVRSVE